MKNLKSLIESGILEAYVLGNTTAEQTDYVAEMAAVHEEIRLEIDGISEALELYAMANAVAPNRIIRPFVMATIDFTERMKSGEAPASPPELHQGSKVSDYSAWLNRDDMILSEDFNDIHAKIIGYTPAGITAIVWIKESAPPEVHTNEYERFLIVEGTCNIMVGDDVNELVPGDYFSIPLYKNHQVIVTSLIPCKVVLQRIAA